jgi:pimeloyl-ACP methyl ester carboxylesterase
MHSANLKTPLVLIPGHTATALSWRYQTEAFQRDRQIVIPEQHYALDSIKDMAQDIAPRLPLRFDLVGWSMGGYIAFELYPLVRENVRKVVLICTSARPESDTALARRAELLKSIEAEDLVGVYMRQFDCNLVDPSRMDTAFKRELVAESVRLGELALRNQIQAIVSRNDSRPSLRNMTCEVMIIAARQDAVTPLECSEEIASALPRGTLHVLDDAGHCCPWEKPAEVNCLLRDFLA